MKRATVRVMNSYDYCHFEVALEDDCQDLADVNQLRIKAQKLVDESIRQYKAKKAHETRLANLSFERDRLVREVDYLRANYPESEWTPEQKAKVKALADHDHMQSEFGYDDEDAPW